MKFCSSDSRLTSTACTTWDEESECLKKKGGGAQVTFPFPCRVVNEWTCWRLTLTVCKKGWSVIIAWVGKKEQWGWAKGRGAAVSTYTVTRKLRRVWIKHVAPHCLRRDGHSNILQGRENGFLSRLFMAKILYSFLYNKTSITVWVNGVGRWGRQSAAQCNNNCASALNEPRKRAGSCRY